MIYIHRITEYYQTKHVEEEMTTFPTKHIESFCTKKILKTIKT